MATTLSELRGRSLPITQAISEARKPDPPSRPRWAGFLLLFGLYLTLRGYHAFDGDQAYRLPLLLHRQDPATYATDPFVRAFDAFNPHRGYLTLLDWASRPFGTSTALLGLFVLTLGATALGVDRLARSTWPGSGRWVGLLAVGLVLAAKAGNVGTNHLFESTLLDRLLGFGLGWLALASTIGDPARRIWVGPVALGLAALVHPSVGLQIAATLAATWGVWTLRPGVFGIRRSTACLAMVGLGLAMVPAVLANAGQAGRLFEGMSADEFRLWAVMVQGPQHMLPSTWRASQWLAWGCYPALALLAMGRAGVGGNSDSWPTARVRLASLMGVNLASLGLAYLAVEVAGDLKVTILQPFRMATLARGLALVAISGRLVALWARGDLASRGRAVLVGVGLAGDWMLVVATAVDLAMAATSWARPRSEVLPRRVGLLALILGLVFLARHDTESGHVPLMMGLGALGLLTLAGRPGRLRWSRRRVATAMALAWAVPAVALVTPWAVADPGSHRWSAWLVGRCRFAEVPADDLERLASWCRSHTPESARFIGPPGPKTFRLWSRRALAFNRSGSPYHARGLADWSSRFRDHVGFQGSTADFARAYLDHRHALEAGFGKMTDDELVGLAKSQGATHVLVASSRPECGPGGPLERIRVDGRYAVERVRPGSVIDPRDLLGKNSGRSLFNRK